MRLPTAALILLSLHPLAAQQGNRKGHDNMKPVVPAGQIPPAPVLEPTEALKSFELANGFIIEPVATEPWVEKPVVIDFDAAGRLWVCEMRGYMPDIDGKGETKPQGRIVVLEDTDHDGKIDKRSVFLDQILLPRALNIFPDGLLFLDERNLCWVDRNGLRPAGEVQIIKEGFAKGGNVEHKPNGLLSNLDNWIYLAKSDKRLRRSGGEWLQQPTTFRGQWGIARDDFGRLYHNNNSTFLFGDHIAPDLVHGNPDARMKVREADRLGPNNTWPIRVTPGLNRAYMDKRNGYNQQVLDPETNKLRNCTGAAGMVIYRGTNFPKEWRGRAFSTESTVQLVKAIEIKDTDGRLSGSHPLGEKEFLASTDERFRPVNAHNAPDGSLYIVDMYHGIIQHKTYMTSYLREQTLSRGLDKPGYGHGRIYRVRHKAGKMEKPVDISLLQGRDLVRLLDHPNAWHRETAQRVIVNRGKKDVVGDLVTLTTMGDDLTRIHAIWTLEGLGELRANHLKEAIAGGSPKLQVSALWAATRLPSSEIRQLASGLTRIKPAKEAIPYLAKLLAMCATDESDSALAALIEKHRKSSWVREAAVAGLHGREQGFIEQHLRNSKDKQLLTWLGNAAKGPGRKKVDGGLEGVAAESFRRGKALYHGEAACIGCHGPDGAGLLNLGPPIDGSEWVTGSTDTLIKILLHGMTGPLTVAGQRYTPPAAMPGLSFNPAMTDERIADISTYIRHEWRNSAGVVSKDEVSKVRAETKERAGRPFTEEDFK